MLAEVITRLATFGYTTNTADETLITLLITKVTAEIKLSCGISELPVDNSLLVDIITGEFLQHKMAIGADLGSINLDAVAKSVKIGDTSVDFGSNTSPKARFGILINTLINGNRALITASLRRFDWS